MTFTSVAAQAAEINHPNSSSFILKDIEPDFDVELMTAKTQLGSEKMTKIFQKLIQEARTLARPRASFKVCRVETKAGLDWAYAYVATEGNELAEWFESLSNVRQIMSRPIRYAALKLAEKALIKFIKSKFKVNQLSSMNPGSLNLWPIEQQRPLFDLLAPLPESIGVSLGSKCWMAPDSAVSGVFFETEEIFYNCQLCSLEPCERRKAANLGLTNGWPKSRDGLRRVA